MKPEKREELKRSAQDILDVNGVKMTLDQYFGARQNFERLATPEAVLSLIAQVEAPTMPQWIETANALPELDVPVLAIRNGCWGIGERYTRGDGGVAYRFNNTTAIGDRMKFECWIPLPVAPTIPAIPGTKEGA